MFIELGAIFNQIAENVMNIGALTAPYFSQWETASMTLPVLESGASALMKDPLWRQSGAETTEEYARWAVNICGMACLKMALAARGETHRTIDLARACTAFGGYVVNEADQSIKGLIYAPFVTFVGQSFGLKAETITNLPTTDIPDLLRRHILHRLGQEPDPVAGSRAALARRPSRTGGGGNARDHPLPQSIRP